MATDKDKALYFANLISDIRTRFGLSNQELMPLVANGSLVEYVLDGYEYYHMYPDDLAVEDVVRHFQLIKIQ
ncbi:MAG: hypothetical protein LBR39_00420 [Coriobacteriales bacterium]|jgi:hypothetical protein|nr:hypothetical protein [Coriobacteriales bacterium]